MRNSLKLNIKRSLNIEANGKASQAVLSIKSVEKQPAKSRWMCIWSIEHLCTRGIAIGKDPLETMINAVRVIGLFIHGTEIDGISVWWEKRGDNGGFPVILGSDKENKDKGEDNGEVVELSGRSGLRSSSLRKKYV